MNVNPLNEATALEQYIPPPDPVLALLLLKFDAPSATILEPYTAMAPSEKGGSRGRTASEGDGDGGGDGGGGKDSTLRVGLPLPHST